MIAPSGTRGMLVAAACCALAAPARAEGRDALRWSARLEQGAGWTSNAFENEEHALDALRFPLALDVTLRGGASGRWSWRLDVEAEAEIHPGSGRQRADDWSASTGGEWIARLGRARRVPIELTLAVELAADRPPLTSRLEAGEDFVSSDGTSLADRYHADELAGEVGVVARPDGELSFGGGLRLRRRDYRNDYRQSPGVDSLDRSEGRAEAWVRWRPSRAVDVEWSVERTVRRYDERRPHDARGEPLEGRATRYGEWGAGVDLRLRPSAAHRLWLGLHGADRSDGVDGWDDRRSLRAALRWRFDPAPRWRLRLGLRWARRAYPHAKASGASTARRTWERDADVTIERSLSAAWTLEGRVGVATQRSRTNGHSFDEQHVGLTATWRGRGARRAGGSGG